MILASVLATATTALQSLISDHNRSGISHSEFSQLTEIVFGMISTFWELNFTLILAMRILRLSILI